LRLHVAKADRETLAGVAADLQVQSRSRASRQENELVVARGRRDAIDIIDEQGGLGG